ncbi:hypothetical protein ATANTOWER_028649 [Ataeniobius toweri]|uniref:Uncharacterized protein n=1 Tax=Ataeniobius toweri TaxID=208326 RepID=A0ABU7B003_9TELE|nr:hypothetical protein [Ataeniobius toweri]
MSVWVFRHGSPHCVSQLEQVLRVFPTRTSGVQDLVGYLVQGRRTEVVGIALVADVEQRQAWQVVGLRTGVEGHCNDLIAAFFAVVEVALHFLLLPRRQLVGNAPNAPLQKR